MKQLLFLFLFCASSIHAQLYISPPTVSGVIDPDNFWTNIATQFVLSTSSFTHANDLLGQDIVIKDMSALKTVVISGSNLSSISIVNCPLLEYSYTSTNPHMTAGPDLHSFPNLIIVEVQSNALMVTPPNVTGLSALEILFLQDNAVLASWPVFSGMTSIQTLNLGSNPAITTGPDVSGLTALAALICTNNTLMATAPNVAGCTALTGVLCAGCALSEAAVDSLLAQLDTNGASSGVVNVSGGTNSAPSAAGLVSKASLEGRGWTVTTN
jgi:hypothetical protein